MEIWNLIQVTMDFLNLKKESNNKVNNKVKYKIAKAKTNQFLTNRIIFWYNHINNPNKILVTTNKIIISNVFQILFHLMNLVK